MKIEQLEVGKSGKVGILDVEKDINEMVMAGHNVKKIIKDNTFTGLTAKMKFIGWKRC